MLRVQDLHATALALTSPRFAEELGRFVLIQRPPAPVYLQIAKVLGRGDTVGMAHESRMVQELPSIAAAFGSMHLFKLPGLLEGKQFVIGREPEGALVIHEPSVSGRHAHLSWNTKQQACLLQDLDSRNGTFLNGRRIDRGEAVLADGDAINFGDAQFLFLRAETLREQILSLERSR